MSDSPQIDSLLQALANPSLPGIALGLERVHALLGALGNPHHHLPPVVHVAGTNGKGSLIAYLQAILEASGCRVHRYTSPQLVRFAERIVLAGEEIGEAELVKLLTRVRDTAKTFPATSFESTTAAAFLAFAQTPADVLLLETGMGGRLDATNVIDGPLLTAITPIALDHSEFLGDSLAAIAGEKAGILKQGVPCVVGPQTVEALQVIEQRATELSAPLFVYGREWGMETREGTAFYVSATRQVALHPSLEGEHQLYNAATAVACAEILTPHFNFTQEHVERALTQARWPARLQRLTQGKLVKQLPGSMQLWLDGGHNPHAAKALAAWAATRTQKPVLICGMLTTKDNAEFLRLLAPHVRAGIAIAVDDPQGRSANDMMLAMTGAGIDAQAAAHLEEAIAAAVGKSGKAGDILICGSLALAGKVLAVN